MVNGTRLFAANLEAAMQQGRDDDEKWPHPEIKVNSIPKYEIPGDQVCLENINGLRRRAKIT
jgi:hypothetical protein